jgi:hypothetical protein
MCEPYITYTSGQGRFWAGEHGARRGCTREGSRDDHFGICQSRRIQNAFLISLRHRNYLHTWVSEASKTEHIVQEFGRAKKEIWETLTERVSGHA